jgi:hypothetical protein
MDDSPGIIIALLTVALAVFGIISLVTDNRYFKDIESQCKQQGYIQNKTTRIMCKVEERNEQ